MTDPLIQEHRKRLRRATVKLNGATWSVLLYLDAAYLWAKQVPTRNRPRPPQEDQ